ncbi:MAG: hypothetical protein ACUVWB_13390, partial [Anaerolineae bacterium]
AGILWSPAGRRHLGLPADLWPLHGLSFHQWRHVGSPAAFLRAYREVVRQEPKLVLFDLLGLVVLIWTIAARGWYRPAGWRRLLREGK